MNNLTFDDLCVDMEVYDITDEEVGIILDIDATNKTVEIEWTHEDTNASSISHVFGDQQISVLIRPGDSRYSELLRAVTEKGTLDDIDEADRSAITLTLLVTPWGGT